MAEIKHPVHKIIHKVFHFRNIDRPIPWGSSVRYKRDNFPILFEMAGFKNGAEIGVRKGKYSRLICQGNPNLHLICIDPWAPIGNKYPQEKQDRIYQECLKNLEGFNVTIIRKTSMDAVREIPHESLDFVYIDADHQFDYVMEDIIHWSRRVRSGGIIACHDFHYGSNVDVCDAVIAYTHSHHIDPWYVTKEAQPTAYWVKP
jgi:predicted O-methyltransferase YrrM